MTHLTTMQATAAAAQAVPAGDTAHIWWWQAAAAAAVDALLRIAEVCPAIVTDTFMQPAREALTWCTQLAQACGLEPWAAGHCSSAG